LAFPTCVFTGGFVPALAFASTGLHRSVQDVDARLVGNFDGLWLIGVAAIVLGGLLWVVRLLADAEEGSRRKTVEVFGAFLGFFGAASVFMSHLPGIVGVGVDVGEVDMRVLALPVVLMFTSLGALTVALAWRGERWRTSVRGRGRYGFALATSVWLAALAILVCVPIAGAWSLVWGHAESTMPNVLLGVDRLLASRYWSLRCLSGSGSCGSAVNSIALGSVVACLACLLGSSLAFYVHRTTGGLRKWMAVVVCLPMITPPFLIGLGLSQVFGQAGFVSLLLEATLGVARSRWFFGPYGLILAQVLVFFPIAYFLVLSALDSIGRTQIEAARFLGASDTDVLRSVTLPAIRDPLAVALLIVFVEALSDIGNPLVIGGKLRVLSTELFYSSSAELASGEMTGVPALLMVFIALGMAAVKERFSVRSGRGRAEAFADERGRCELPPIVRRGAGGLLGACVLVLAAVYAAIGIGAFSAGGVATGAFTLENFIRGFGISASGGEISLIGSAWNSLIASLSCAFLVAPVGGAIGIAMVWTLQRGGIACSPLVERISSYVLSVPSVVIGAGFLLAFGHLGLSTRGAWMLILLAMLIRNLAVCMRFGGVALRRVDSSLSELSGLFGAGSLTTFSRVIAPMLRSTFVVCVAYGFVRSMTMLGSVLLLSSAENQVATTYMIDRVGIGEYGVSMAYGVVLAACISSVLGLIWMFSSVRKNAPELRKAIGDLKAAVIHA
jgi:iron(III) transport system permease protein